MCGARLAWSHVHGDHHHPLRGRRRRPGRGGAGLPAGPGGRAGHAARVPARLRPPVPWRRPGPARARGARRSGARRSAARRRAARHRRRVRVAHPYPRLPPGRLPAREREVPVLRAGPAGPVPAVHGAGGRPLPGIPRRDGGAGVRAAPRRRRDAPAPRPRRRRRVHPRRSPAAAARGPGRRRRRAQLEDPDALDDHRHRARCAPGHLLVRGAPPGQRPTAVGPGDHRRARRLARGPRPGRQLAARLPDPRGGRSRRCARVGSGRWSERSAGGCPGSATGSTG